MQACIGKDRVSFHTGGAADLRPGAISQSPGREAALPGRASPSPSQLLGISARCSQLCAPSISCPPTPALPAGISPVPPTPLLLHHLAPLHILGCSPCLVPAQAPPGPEPRGPSGQSFPPMPEWRGWAEGSALPLCVLQESVSVLNLFTRIR